MYVNKEAKGLGSTRYLGMMASGSGTLFLIFVVMSIGHAFIGNVMMTGTYACIAALWYFTYRNDWLRLGVLLSSVEFITTEQEEMIRKKLNKLLDEVDKSTDDEDNA